MIWHKQELAWFTALAMAVAMREAPIIAVIDGGKQRSSHGEESEEDRREDAA